MHAKIEKYGSLDNLKMGFLNKYIFCLGYLIKLKHPKGIN